MVQVEGKVTAIFDGCEYVDKKRRVVVRVDNGWEIKVTDETFSLGEEVIISIVSKLPSEKEITCADEDGGETIHEKFTNES